MSKILEQEIILLNEKMNVLIRLTEELVKKAGIGESGSIGYKQLDNHLEKINIFEISSRQGLCYEDIFLKSEVIMIIKRLAFNINCNKCIERYNMFENDLKTLYVIRQKLMEVFGND